MKKMMMSLISGIKANMMNWVITIWVLFFIIIGCSNFNNHEPAFPEITPTDTPTDTPMDTLTNTPTSIPTNTPGIGHIYLTVIGNDDIGGTGNGWILFDPVLINGISRIDARYGIYEYDLFYSNSHSVLLHAYTDGRAFLDHWKYNGIQTRNNPVEVEVGTTIEVMFLAPDPTPTPTLSPRN